jgi:hypothetical protein
MAKISINIKIVNKNNAARIESNPGSTIDDISATKDTYLIVYKDNYGTAGNIEVREEDGNNTERVKIKATDMDNADVANHIFFRLSRVLARKIRRLIYLKKVLMTQSGDKQNDF